METEAELQRKVEDLDEEIETLQAAEKVRKTILEEAAEQLEKRGIKVVVSENDSVLRIPNELLGFDTAAYDIRLEYQTTAYAIGEVLYEVINKGNRKEYLDTIFIEGHTDNRPFNGFMGKGNWGLSTFRAISLWQYWSEALPKDKNLKNMLNEENKPLFSVSGYGETRPVTDEQVTEEQLSENRRIDIRLTISKPKSDDIQRLQQEVIGSENETSIDN